MKTNLKILLAVFVVQSIGFGALPDRPEKALIKGIRQTVNIMLPEPDAAPIRSQITAEVMSNGCTESSSFEARVVHTSAFPQPSRHQVLTLVRVKEDTCDGVPHRVTVEIPTQLLLDSRQVPVFLGNPVLTNVQIGH